MVLECVQIIEASSETLNTGMSQSLAGLGTSAQEAQDLVGPATETETTQAYVQAYHEALEGYRKRFAVLERYSALLQR